MESGDECLEEMPRESVFSVYMQCVLPHKLSYAFPLILLEANDSLLLALCAMHVITLSSQNWLLSGVHVFLIHYDGWRSHYF